MRLSEIVVAAIVLMSVPLDRSMAASRYESTRPLKQVVYAGAVQEYPSLYINPNPYPSWDRDWYAVISVSEISLVNMPNVQLYAYYNGHWTVWQKAWFEDGKVYLNWGAYNNGGGPSYPYSTTYFTRFKIVVTYESGVTLDVQNSGTGKSLDLKWTTDTDTSNKITGYEVWRRPKQ